MCLGRRGERRVRDGPDAAGSRDHVALELLAAHQRRLASAALAQERDAARIGVTCKLAGMQVARLQWRSFTASWPGSPLIDSVRSSCHS